MFKPYNVNTNVIDFYFKDCDLYELRTGWNGFLQQPHISYSLFILNLYHLIHGLFTSNIDRDCRRSGKYKETTIRRRVRIVLNCYIQLYLFFVSIRKNNLLFPYSQCYSFFTYYGYNVTIIQVEEILQ